MSRQVRSSRTSLWRQLGIVAFSFVLGQFVSTRLLPANLGFTPRLLVFLAVYGIMYVVLWRLTEELRRRQEAGRRN